MRETPLLIPSINKRSDARERLHAIQLCANRDGRLSKERALWAVLIKYPGDDKYTIRAAQELTDKYLAEERFQSIDISGSLFDRSRRCHATNLRY